MKIGRDFELRLGQVRLWNGRGVGEGLKEELRREYARMKIVDEQIKGLEGEQQRRVREEKGKSVDQIRQLMLLKSIGQQSSWILVQEFFGWRGFKNRRQVGGCAGLVPTPYNSGDSEREQGISKAGNARIRKLMVELSWLWLRYQPDSKLSQWYRERFGSGGKRMRRIGIVALARKLLVALWKYLDRGEIPEGAVLKAI
jgi:transposase